MGGCAWRGGRCLAKSGGGRLELKGGIIGGFLGGEQPYRELAWQWQ